MEIDYAKVVLSAISIVIIILCYLIPFIVLAVATYGISSIGIISSNTLNFILEAESLLSLSIAVFLYAKFYKKESLSETLSFLGLSKDRISFNALWVGLLLFVIILLMEMAVGAFGNFSNTAINTNTNILFVGAPLWFYLFVAVIEPINEEIFFRGFLLNRINIGASSIFPRLLRTGSSYIWIGIISSAIIFGLLHSSYDSTFAIEVIAATAFGLLAGYVYKKSDSLYPSMLTHIMINSIAVLAILSILG